MANEERLVDANLLPVSKEYCLDEAGFGATFYVVHKDSIDNAPTVDAVKVIRCQECRFWMAEAKERCEKLGTQPFGWCLKDRNLDEMDWREHRYQHDFCSRGKKKGTNDDDDSDCD